MNDKSEEIQSDSSVDIIHTLHSLSAGNTTTTSKNIFVADADWKSDLAAMQPLLTQWVSASDASAIAVRTAGQDDDDTTVNIVAVVGQGLHCACFS